jgi:hypothetical protein
MMIDPGIIGAGFLVAVGIKDTVTTYIYYLFIGQ